jgi:hypothetical protein
MRFMRGALCIVALMVVAIPSFAHHGNAAFVAGKRITIKGTLTEWVWSNPHCFLMLDAKDDSGQSQHWVIEATAIPSLIDIGITKISFKPGEQLSVTLTPVKSGQPIGRVMNVVLPTGKTVYFSSEGSGLTVDRNNEEEALMKVNRTAQSPSASEDTGR